MFKSVLLGAHRCILNSIDAFFLLFVASKKQFLVYDSWQMAYKVESFKWSISQ